MAAAEECTAAAFPLWTVRLELVISVVTLLQELRERRLLLLLLLLLAHLHHLQVA